MRGLPRSAWWNGATRTERASGTLSLDLFGGHCYAQVSQIGYIVEESDMMFGVMREMNRRLLLRGSGEITLEVWEEKLREPVFMGRQTASPYLEYADGDWINMGLVEYRDEANSEYSYVFAMPIPAYDVEQLLAAGKYPRDGEKQGVQLPLHMYAEEELRALYGFRMPNREICDAITRLWEPQNAETYARLTDFINRVKEAPWPS